jgi:phosphoserine phosphatase
LFIATIVDQRGLPASVIAEAAAAIGGDAGALIEGVACDLHFAGDPAAARATLEAFDGLDVVVQREADRARKLLVADMDSTMITVECIDELADYVGLKAEVSAVTEAAMRGELDFAEALAARVALLDGLPLAKAEECLRERVKLMPGAKDLIAAFRAAGGYTVLVSGGFTLFAESVGRDLGFDRVVANTLLHENAALTGKTGQPIVDSATKNAVLLAELAERGLPASASLAVGDGANDIPMIEAAGLGVAYHAKPRTEAAADARVHYGDLNVVRYALGL